ncbi:hypothetical protein DQW77_01905 [Roseovarius sp. TE539]|uniref:c-type cytochrome n=1 Tax=Roseovarius sp. TE539 TaxID=2249812 RepID=UPI000DFAFB63|nr:cytochrome c family protein [Roseovarius sp. TE539]RBI77209.1 hypothetical protein DQW77_01905 [Roseovarius sp. TE539]
MRKWVIGLGIAMAGPAMAADDGAGDATAGERTFKRCSACHQVGEGASNRVGPVLSGVIGRQAGSYEGYRYGDDMIAAGEAGLVWSEDALFEYLAGPRDFLRAYLDDPGAKAKMRFRLKDAQDRRDVIAYLATFSDAPAAAEEEQASAGVAAPEAQTAETRLCVRNRNTHEHFFAVEADGAERRTGFLAPGEKLCIEGAPGATGTVSVYEEADGFEGCSRLVPVGKTEDMLKYVDFDRCFWSSNT